MKKLMRIISVVIVFSLVLSVPITAFARTLYEQVEYLDDQEIFDGIWDNVLTDIKTGKESKTGNTFLISYYNQDLKGAFPRKCGSNFLTPARQANV